MTLLSGEMRRLAPWLKFGAHPLPILGLNAGGEGVPVSRAKALFGRRQISDDDCLSGVRAPICPLGPPFQILDGDHDGGS